MQLNGTRVLIVEDDEDSREMLGFSLSSKGAVVNHAASGENALELLQAWKAGVVLMDLSLPGMDGISTFTQIRDLPDYARCIGIALSGRGRWADRARTLAAGFTKHLVKPATVGDILSAIEVSVRRPDAPTMNIRTLVEQLNIAGTCQFTSVLRFSEQGSLVSMWTYDRALPTVDSFPVDLAIEASYCVLVRDTGQPVLINDARVDKRVTEHPKRTELAAYLGVPILRADGSLYGTLCSFDASPQAFTPASRSAHEAAARTLTGLLDR